MDSELLQPEEQFDAETFGAEHFSEVQEDVVSSAVPASELADAINADQQAAVSDYANPSRGGPVYTVTFSGPVSGGYAGRYTIEVEDVPDDLTVRVQTGPAINGNELRDVTGTMPY